MIAAIHQPHYLPWLGYMDKMIQSDAFIILDDVQLTDQSPMLRNKFLANDGKELYLTVETFKKHYHGKKNREIQVDGNSKWQCKQEKFFIFNYKKHPYFDEIWPHIENIFHKDYLFLIDVEMDSIHAIRSLFGIEAPIHLQSELPYDEMLTRNELLANLLGCIKADVYLSGRGAKAYMQKEIFGEQGIEVVYQRFSAPEYSQMNGKEGFVPNLSSLDLLFNCGAAKAREILLGNRQAPEEA